MLILSFVVYIIIQHLLTAAQLINSMNPKIDPCDDFFEYACGNWNKKNVIPEDKSSYNTFEKLHDELQITLKGKLQSFIHLYCIWTESVSKQIDFNCFIAYA